MTSINSVQCVAGSFAFPEAAQQCGRLRRDTETLRDRREQVEEFVTFLAPNLRTPGWPIAVQYAGRDIKEELDTAEEQVRDAVNEYERIRGQGQDASVAYNAALATLKRYDDVMTEILGLKNPVSAGLCEGEGVTKFYVPSIVRQFNFNETSTATSSAGRQGLDRTLRCEQVVAIGGKVLTKNEFESAGGQLCKVAEADFTRAFDGSVRALPAGFLSNDRFSQQRSCAETYNRSSVNAPAPAPVTGTNSGSAAAPASPAAPTAPTVSQQVQTWRTGLSEKGRLEGTADALALIYTDVMSHQMKNGAGASFDYSLRIAERWKQAETRQMMGLKWGLLELHRLEGSDADVFMHVLQNAGTYFKGEGIQEHLAKYRQRVMQSEAPAPAPTPPSAPVRPPIQIRDLQFEAVDPGPFTQAEFKALRELVKAGWETDLRAYITAMYCDSGQGGRIAEFTSADNQWPEQMCAAPMTRFYGSVLNPESIIPGRRGSLISEDSYLIGQLGMDKFLELKKMVSQELKGKPGRPGQVYQQWVDQAMKIVVREASPQGLRNERQRTLEGGGNAMTTMKNYWAAHKLDFAKAVLLNVLSLPPGSAERKAAVDELGQMMHIWSTPR